ncbi:MAG: chemotaxis protein CheW [Actinomycetota bacterium]
MDHPNTPHQLCTFRVGSCQLGIDIAKVREVLAYADLTPVPHADPAIRGLCNLRGQIATTIDLGIRLGIDPDEHGDDPVHVVVQSTREPVTLLVDAIGDVIDADPERYEAPPSTMIGSSRELIVGAYKLDHELLLVLDVERAVQPVSAPVAAR